MTLAAWPGTVTNYVLSDGYGEEPQRNVSAFETDIGPPLEARMSSVPNDIIEGRIRCKSSTEYEALRTFYSDTLSDGILPFTRTHPRTQTANCIFKFDSFKLNSVRGQTYEVAVTLRYLR